jgi:hypothetical protein
MIASPALTQSQKNDFDYSYRKEDFFSKGTVAAGNDIYKIAIEDILGEGVGLYTIRTGPRHPITQNMNKKPQDLLAGGAHGEMGRPGTSYLTIRSYTTQTDYVQTEFARADIAPKTGPKFKLIWLDSTFINEQNVVPKSKYLREIINGDNTITGYRVIYDLPGLADSRKIPDRLVITQKIEVHGTDINDSWVQVTTIVKNKGQEAVEIGIRYLWDLNIGHDDGPELFEQTFNTSFGQREKSIDWVNFGFFMAAGTDTTTGQLYGFNVYGSGITPTNLLRVPLQPTLIQQVAWLNAFFKPFAYEVNPNRKVTVADDSSFSLPGGDNAVQFFWGDKLDNAIKIMPDDSVQVTQGLFASLTGDRPTVYDAVPPTIQVTKWQFEPTRRIELFIQDEISGLRLRRAHNLFNAKIEVPNELKTGATEAIPIVVTAIDEAEPVGFLIEAVDLCGNIVSGDPIFLTLKPELRVFNYTVEPLFSDRYFYIKNQGVRRIVANLNGHEFILSAENRTTLRTAHTITMPLNGEITIDIKRYLKENGNTLSISYDGPEGSRADLVLSDVLVKNSVDLDLNLSPLPQQFALCQNWPNPFRGGTQIQFDVPASLINSSGAEKVELRIYNLLGQLVRTLVDENLQAGSYNARWNGRNENGRLVAAGVYLYNLTAGNIRLTKKMVLMR